MSSSRATVEQIYTALGAGDIPAVLGAFAPEIEWTEAEGFPYGGVYTGPQAILDNVLMKLGTEWEGFAAVPHRLVVDGDTVVAVGTYTGAYRATGKTIAVPFAHVWTVSDGKATHFQQITDTAVVQQALA